MSTEECTLTPKIKMPTDEPTDKEIYGHAQAISWKEHSNRHTDLTHIPVKLNVGWMAVSYSKKYKRRQQN